MKGIPNPRKGVIERKRSSKSIPHMPMEWMDPMSWRLPSGKALAANQKEIACVERPGRSAR